MSEAFLHKTVLLDEAVDGLNIRPDGVYVDCTFGRGGHSRLILEKLGEQGRLIALDRDLAGVEEAQKITDPRFQIVHSSFSRLRDVLKELGVAHVDGVLLDLGISSPQIDEAVRGFSFRFDGPLDMRMDTSHGQTAAEWLADVTEQQLGEVIKNYGEERYAKQIARAIVAARSGEPVVTTRQLSQIVAKAFKSREPHQDPATRTFQAIRIYLNQELEELSLVLPQCVDVLAPFGRLVVISFHSLEDRVVKRFMRDGAQPAVFPARLPLRAAELPAPHLRLVGKAARPSAAEVSANPRSRSATMRVAERTEAAL
ncbi:S-adenosyl-methyltransferase MraW [Sulfuricella denitrificans skB26]|uniref:Ribosomal RNA small subunit methyltransferase H n=1 Tax=Sulfuricella denitrificans (strain DSM 22764 / NBRC 105220 / skB26) TaxID=1163617 RepID=S6AAW3_SULDS|nr:16S rRNA (cytosine(1402)-N(4))-methyltransferase RsmH [Sulfuricella denitrificans]BAN36300.1 S-adenosyl-methyltransferase MraW [Sulfuricella denitrificans skB26]